MALNLTTLLSAIQGVELAIADVEKGVSQGAGNLVSEIVDSGENLWNDAAFKQAVLNFVAALKA